MCKDVNIINCEFTHTGMMGLFVSHSSNVLIDRNVFTDIGKKFKLIQSHSLYD